ncbi:prophage tail fiber N-terminal domain-containing protein [Salmonella enterica]|nr:prophage tail fiber N-terminal domain-containing protein [Salmonella enterica]EKF7980444.1 prophage tail fiber N-terminal domain-containing protein [Salmonella enterica]
MPIISGVLKDGAGQPIAGCTIQLKATNTTSVVIRTTTARVGVTAGVYRIEAQPARYEVTLAVEDYPPQKVGVIDVYADSPDGTLNDFLTATKVEYLTPDVMNQFKLLAQQAREAAEAANTASQVASTIKDAAEKAAGNAVLSENSAADSALAARASEINAAGSVAKAATSAAAALVSQNAAKSSEINASVSVSAATVSETSAAISASDALASKNAAKLSETAAAVSATTAGNHEATAFSNANAARRSGEVANYAATVATAAKDAVISQVTGFDAHVSQQVTVITQAAASATTKANADIASATDINRNNAILAINKKQAEATAAILTSVDTAELSALHAFRYKTDANNSDGRAFNSATAAKASEDAAALSEVNAGKSAADAQAYALTVIQQTTQVRSAATEIANQSRLITERALRTQESESRVDQYELNVQQRASTVESIFNRLTPLVMDPVTGDPVDISAKVSGFATRAETAAASAEASNVEAQKASTTAARDTAQKLLPLLTELSTTVEGVKTKTDAEVARLTASAALAVTNAEKSSTSASASAQQAQQALEEARLIARLPLPGEVGSYVFAEADGGGPGFGGEIEGEWLHPTAHIDGDLWMNENNILTRLQGTWMAAGYFLDVGRQQTLFIRIR